MKSKHTRKRINERKCQSRLDRLDISVNLNKLKNAPLLT